jgi:hypothetical protein
MERGPGEWWRINVLYEYDWMNVCYKKWKINKKTKTFIKHYARTIDLDVRGYTYYFQYVHCTLHNRTWNIAKPLHKNESFPRYTSKWQQEDKWSRESRMHLVNMMHFYSIVSLDDDLSLTESIWIWGGNIDKIDGRLADGIEGGSFVYIIQYARWGGKEHGCQRLEHLLWFASFP